MGKRLYVVLVVEGDRLIDTVTAPCEFELENKFELLHPQKSPYLKDALYYGSEKLTIKGRSFTLLTANWGLSFDGT